MQCPSLTAPVTLKAFFFSQKKGGIQTNFQRMHMVLRRLKSSSGPQNHLNVASGTARCHTAGIHKFQTHLKLNAVAETTISFNFWIATCQRHRGGGGGVLVSEQVSIEN